MNTQPEALRLAKLLEGYYEDRFYNEEKAAAAELRRLHDVNQELRGAIKRIEQSTATELSRLHALNAELVTSLERIATAAEATVCNVEWIAKHARAAITKAEGQQ